MTGEDTNKISNNLIPVQKGQIWVHKPVKYNGYDSRYYIEIISRAKRKGKTLRYFVIRYYDKNFVANFEYDLLHDSYIPSIQEDYELDLGKTFQNLSKIDKSTNEN